MTEPIVVQGARVVLKPLIFSFAVLAGYFLAFGFIFCMDAIVRAFFGTVTGPVGWIPFAGKVITAPLVAIEHKLTSFLGGLEAHFEHQMATRWHAFASVVEQLAIDARAAAVFDWQIARKLATLWGNAVVAHISGAVHHAIRVVRSEVHTITRTVVRVEKIAGAKADRYIVHKVGVLAGELEHVIEWTIPGLRARERALGGSLGRLWHRVRARETRIGATAAAALVAAALARLGMGALRCKNVNRVAKNICGMNPAALDALLAGTIVLASPISVVELTKAAQAFTAEAEDGLRWFVRELQ